MYLERINKIQMKISNKKLAVSIFMHGIQSEHFNHNFYYAFVSHPIPRPYP